MWAGQLLQAYTMVEKTRQAFKLEHRERKLKQIFVRGSNIVMITSATYVDITGNGSKDPWWTQADVQNC